MNSSEKKSVVPWLVFLMVMAIAYSLFRGGAGGSLGDVKGQVPPAIDSAGTWIGSQPMTLPSLTGKVVWLQFSFLH